jgi:trehalose-phosphatase
MAGKANLEVRPTFVNKGEITKKLVEKYGDEAPDFILCVGDDSTDEGMSYLPRRSANTIGLNTRHQICSDLFAPPISPKSTFSRSPWVQARR